MPGKEPVRFFEMNLKRVGDTNWPPPAPSVPSDSGDTGSSLTSKRPGTRDKATNYLVTCAYFVALVVVVYFTRATSRRIAGALAGGAAVGCFGMGAIVFGNALGLWRVPIFWTPYFVALFYLGLAISCSPFISLPGGWRAGSDAGLGSVPWRRGDHRPTARLLVRCEVPGMDGLVPGVAPIIADALAYNRYRGHRACVMRLIAGPSRADRLRNES